MHLDELRRRDFITLSGGAAAWRISSTIWLAVVVGSLYILSARLSLSLLTPTGVAVFWPAAGVAAGVPIALWPRGPLGGDNWADGRDPRRHPPGRSKPLEFHRLRALQRGGSRADRVAGRALLWFAFQSRPAEPRAGPVGGRDCSNRRLRNRRDPRVCLVPWHLGVTRVSLA